MQIYPTDLTNSQWAKIENLFDNRKRKHLLRAIIIPKRWVVERTFGWFNFDKLIFIGKVNIGLEQSKKGMVSFEEEVSKKLSKWLE